MWSGNGGAQFGIRAEEECARPQAARGEDEEGHGCKWLVGELRQWRRSEGGRDGDERRARVEHDVRDRDGRGAVAEAVARSAGRGDEKPECVAGEGEVGSGDDDGAAPPGCGAGAADGDLDEAEGASGPAQLGDSCGYEERAGREERPARILGELLGTDHSFLDRDSSPRDERSEDGAPTGQVAPQCADFYRSHIGAGCVRGGGAGRFSGRHRGRDLLRCLVHVPARRDAAPGHQQVGHGFGGQRAVGDVVDDLALRPVAGAGDRVGEAVIAVGLLEHVVADEPPALGDADHLRDVVEPGAWMLGDDAGDLGPHRVAAFELGRGEVVGVGCVDPPAERTPRHERAPGRGRAERGCRVVEAAHPEPQPGRDRDGLECRSGGDEHVAVAARVDHDARHDDFATAFRFEDDGFDRALGCVRARAPRVEQHPYACLPQHVVRHVDECFGVERDRIAHDIGRRAPNEPVLAPAVDDRRIERSPFGRRREPGRARGVEPVDGLLAHAAHNLRAAPVVECEQQVDEPERREPADEAVALDEPHVRAPASGRDRGRDPRRPGADHEHVGPPDDR